MATIYFATDQSGANTEVCTTSSSIFNFSASAAHTVAYASLVVKKGSSTTVGITAALYDAANGGGSVVASVTVTAANVSQTYTATTFTFPANTTLTANQTYSLKISSTTACGGSAAYFFKAGNFQIYNNDTSALVSVGYGIAGDATTQATATADAKADYTASAAATGQSQITASASAAYVMAADAVIAAQTTAGAVGEYSLSADINLQTQTTADTTADYTIAADVVCETQTLAEMIADFVARGDVLSIVTASAAAMLLDPDNPKNMFLGLLQADALYFGDAPVTKVYLGENPLYIKENL